LVIALSLLKNPQAMKAAGLFLVFFLILSCDTLFCQTETGRIFLQKENDTIHATIITITKNEYSGQVLSENKENVELEVEPGIIITIPKIKILDYKIIESEIIKDGEVYFSNPHATRYFYGPNGYGLKREEGYYQNLWVMFNQVSYGFSDNFSVGVGVIPLFLFAGAATPVWITPKVSIPLKKDKINMGAGALMATIIGESEASFGIAYGTFTVGSMDSNATLGAGWAYTTDGFGERPTLSLSAMYRYGKKGYLLTENYLISTASETIGIFAFGGRSVQKKLAVDYGLAIPLNIGETFAFPWLSITLPFGEGRR
jgi:hypothetical protein